MFHYNRNEFEQYPFKEVLKEDLPILDIRSTSAYLLKVSPTEIILEGGVTGTPIPGRQKVILRNSSFQIVGHVLLSKDPQKEYIGKWAIQDTCIYDDLQIKGVGTINGLSGDISILAGNNVLLENSLEVSFLLYKTHINYLKQLGTLTGQNLVVYGREFIRVNGLELSTAVSDLKLLCPVVLAGEGEAGASGSGDEKIVQEEVTEDVFSPDVECEPPIGSTEDI